jgi:hypothetical protein
MPKKNRVPSRIYLQCFSDGELLGFSTENEITWCSDKINDDDVMDVPAQADLKFLKEMRERLNDGWDRKDVTQIEFVQTMLEDWIDKLDSETEPL